MVEQIKAGDRVRLKSGGPVMTASWVSEELGTVVAGCAWFDKDNKNQFERFPVVSLEVVD